MRKLVKRPARWVQERLETAMVDESTGVSPKALEARERLRQAGTVTGEDSRTERLRHDPHKTEETHP